MCTLCFYMTTSYNILSFLICYRSFFNCLLRSKESCYYFFVLFLIPQKIINKNYLMLFNRWSINYFSKITYIWNNFNFQLTKFHAKYYLSTNSISSEIGSWLQHINTPLNWLIYFIDKCHLQLIPESHTLFS